MRIFFALNQQVGRNYFAIDFPFIGANCKGGELLYFCPEPFEWLVATRADFDGNDALFGTRVSKPNP